MPFTLQSPVMLEIPADPACLFIVRAAVGKIAEKFGLHSKEERRCVLAVDEACANVIRHAYGNVPSGRIIVTFDVSAENLEIRIRDFGQASDPATFKPRDLADVRPGGLGLHFMRSAFDELRYESPPDGGTLLTMVKFRPKEEAFSH
ncbi:MAG: ATP-binding protein [Desulfobacteraceae bacterium]|nr:ATP-binding protein [Desulfobacteraceae bacterium]